jgi:carbonic anhydrase
MLSASQAVERLLQGNHRFVSGAPKRCMFTNNTYRKAVIAGQEPFAVILGCSDSRVPVELVFDQAIGDLFVIRVAGNIVTPANIGSIEYAVNILGTRLVMVLGHCNCGAVQSTLDAFEQPTKDLSPNIQSLIDYIRPSIEPIWEQHKNQSRDTMIEQAVRANIRASAHEIQQGSQIVKDRIKNDTLLIVGAEYSLETGVVEIFENL